MATVLEQLRESTTIVADTGDFESLKKYKPTDATTNPSLILAAANMKQYDHLIEDVIKKIQEKDSSSSNEQAIVDDIMDNLFVTFGEEILKIVPGRVSTEVDARLSFDREGQIKKARHLIGLYDKRGISKDRILIIINMGRYSSSKRIRRKPWYTLQYDIDIFFCTSISMCRCTSYTYITIRWTNL
jgi:transaldolase